MDANIDRIMREYGIPHWRVTVSYERILPDPGDDPNWVTHMRVTTLPEYERAMVKVDYDSIPDEAALEDDLRHECGHIVHSPMELVIEAAWPFVQRAGQEACDSFRGVQRFAVEMLARNIERMSYGHKSEDTGKADDDEDDCA